MIDHLRLLIRRWLALPIIAGSLLVTISPVLATNPPVNVCTATAPGQTCSSNVPGTQIWYQWSLVSCPGTQSGYAEDYSFYTVNAAGNLSVFVPNTGFSIDWTALGAPDDGEIFYWETAAYCASTGGWSAWSPWSFVKNGPSAAPTAPSLISPSNNSHVDSTSITFKWNRAPRSIQQNLQVISDNCPGGPSGSTLNNVTLDFNLDCDTSAYPTVTCTKALSGYRNIGQTLRWYVAGGNELGWSPFSSRTLFNGTAPSAAVLTSPAPSAGAPGTSVHFTWQSSARTVNYRLQVSRNSDLSSPFHDQTYTGLEADVTGFADDGKPYYWKVTPHNCAGDAATPNTSNFLNTIVNCTAGIGTGTSNVYPYSQSHIDTCSVTSNNVATWYLWDISRRSGQAPIYHHSGVMPSTSAISTRNYVSPTASVTVTDADNVWATQGSAVDGQVNAGLFYDYLLSNLAMSSFDGVGSSMVSLVDVPVFPAFPNAYWDDVQLRVSYTVGAGASAPYSGSYDMVGHVWGEAITDRGAVTRGSVSIPWIPGRTTKGLVPAWESGALRIAFGDWMGTAFEAARAGNPAVAANWTIGDPSIVIRDLSIPPAYGQPDTYNSPAYLKLTQANCMPGTNDPTLNQDCGASVNSGVPNKMFYLLAVGGTHNGVAVSSIGLLNAMKLALKANRFYWMNNATFQNASAGMVSAAANANEANQVKNAWAAVGVGTIPAISVSASPVEGGTVTGGGNYSFGASATVTATANPGFQFVNWTENGTQASTSSSYTFPVNGSRTLVANFAVYSPKISVTPALFDFGTYSVGQSSPPQTFTVKNVGSAPLILGTVSLGGLDGSDFDLTADACSAHTVALNGTCTVQVKFAPTASGPRSGTLTIPSNDPDLPEVIVPLTGAVLTVQTALVELPNSDSGPNQGSPSPAGAHYLNVDDDPHDGDATMITFSSGGSKEVFTVADQLLDSDVVTSLKVRWAAKRGSGSEWSGKAGLVVAGGEYYGPGVELSPSYLVREETFLRNPWNNQAWTVQDVRDANLVYQQVTTTAELPRASLSEIVLVVTVQRIPTITVVASPAAGGSVSGGGLYPFGSPVTVTATANTGYVFVNWTEAGVVVSTSSSYAFTAGGNRSLVANFAVNVSDIQVDPAAVSFGSVSVGESSPAQFVTVINQGYAPLVIGTVSMTGANPYDFSPISDGCSGQTLPTSDSCTLQVVFTPKTTGSRSATLSISSNDPDTPQIGVPLSGSAQTVVYDLVERPNGDAGPNGGGPTPTGPHYLNVDDDPHDGDTTYLAFASSGKEVFTVADQLHDTDVITRVKVRWAAKRGSGDDWSGKAGVVFNGQEYYGPTAQLSPGYSAREEVFTINPATGQPWTVSDVRSLKLVYQQVTTTTELPKARLTELVLVVSARRTPFAGSLTELPNGDAGPNGGSPMPTGAHYLNVDDDPQDGDTTYLAYATAGKDVFSIADQLLDTDLVTGVTVRWAAKRGSGDEWSGRAGVVVGGQEYYGPTIELPPSYSVQNDTFTSNPANGQPWTVADVRALQLVYQLVTSTTELPKSRLTELVLVVSLQRMPVLATLTERPNSDASPNQGAPSPSGAHYLNVDEDPHDGDTTHLKFVSAGAKEVFTTADQLLDTDHVQYVKVRWVAKKGSGPEWQARAGLVIGGQEYYGSTVYLTAAYVVREETFTANPATGQPWTVTDVRNAKLIYQQVTTAMQLPRAAMTELVFLVTVERAP